MKSYIRFQPPYDIIFCGGVFFMKKFGFISLAVIFAFVLVACGTKNTGIAPAVNEATGETEYSLRNPEYDSVEVGTPEKALDPEAIYDSLTYIPEMFYGQYQLIGGDSAIEQYCAEMDYMDYKEADSVGTERIRSITTIPFELRAGTETLHSHINDDKSRNWIEAYFKDDKGNLLIENFAYEIQGKTITMQHLRSFQYDEATNKTTYTMDEDMAPLSYEFEFKGTTLTLSAGGKSVTMNAGYNYGDEKEPTFIVDSYISLDEPRIDDIVGIDIYRSEDVNRLHFRIFTPTETSEKNVDVVYENSAVMSENGLLTFTIPYETGTKTYQYLYFYLDDDGMILTDGSQIYKYMHTWTEYRYGDLFDSVDPEIIDGLTEAKLKELQEAKEAILKKLQEAFAAHNVKADIDLETGRVTMDTNFLFDVDSTEISAEGKAYLDGFAAAYSEAVLAEAQAGTVGKILVEGHTDTSGTHEYNQDLSERRAAAVADYCVQIQPKLASLIESKGYSFDNPVFDENGKVDMDASRRVVFKFMLDVN